MSDAIPAGVIHNADNDLKRIANLARGIIALDEAVARFGGLAGAIAEAQARLDKLTETERAARAEMAEEVRAHNAALAADELALNERRATASKEAQAILARAQASADQIITEAKATAKARLDELARQERERHAAIDAAHEQLGALSEAIAARMAEHEQLSAAVCGLHNEHDRIAGEIEALRVRIGGR